MSRWHARRPGAHRLPPDGAGPRRAHAHVFQVSKFEIRFGGGEGVADGQVDLSIPGPAGSHGLQPQGVLPVIAYPVVA